MGLRVYIAGPLTKGDRPMNVRNAIDTAQSVLVRGHFPFVPHLFDFWNLIWRNDYERWMSLDLSFLSTCHILVRLPGESPGSDREVEFAKANGIPVFFGLQHFKESRFWTMEKEEEYIKATLPPGSPFVRRLSPGC